jgi:hypothetical protein
LRKRYKDKWIKSGGDLACKMYRYLMYLRKKDDPSYIEKRKKRFKKYYLRNELQLKLYEGFMYLLSSEDLNKAGC